MEMNWTAVLWFLAIVASIPVLLWLFKRSQLMGGATASGTARPVAVLPLSPSQKLVTVELGRGEDKLWLVLGVTPSSITTLHTMAALPPLPPQAPGSGADAPDGGSTADSFAQLLERLRGGDPGNKHGR